MILAVGVDVLGVDRFACALARTPTLRDRLFTPAERGEPVAGLAGCFAAKEALVKALGAPAGLAWHDAEVRAGSFDLRGSVLAAVRDIGATRAHLHLTRRPAAVTALVTLES